MKTYVYSYTTWLNESFVEDFVNDLPNPLILKRIVFLKSIDDFDKEQPGKFWTLKKDTSSMVADVIEHGTKKRPFIITAKVPKDQIHLEETIRIRKDFPLKQEIVVKNQGRGVDVLRITPYSSK